ncbi:hypothetical protein ACO0LB_12190 [Undibacterium sp. SXout7W]|uniref:hypothetical protein n=1 Tax=Undibacterium sp. SXout7W TaxID=3413049 RepID=UPI003BF095EC
MNVDQIVASWIADEEEVCSRLREPGMTSPEPLASRSGIAFFERIFAGGGHCGVAELLGLMTSCMLMSPQLV